jgi:hypothetical protein
MTHHAAKPLTEKELGSLYIVSETPMMIDGLLKNQSLTDEDMASFHQSFGHHAPDMAMIAAGLSGNIIALALLQIEDTQIEPLATELKHLSVNTAEEVGRIWIDACRYDMAREDDIRDIVQQSPDILCIFASLFMDIAEACTGKYEIIRGLSAILHYQCEAHADNARAMIDNAERHEKVNSSSRDMIPIPEEIYQDKNYQDNIVPFSLFVQR